MSWFEDINPNGTLGHFGMPCVAAGDIDGDGIADLVTGANPTIMRLGLCTLT